jgi:hypothetical protein
VCEASVHDARVLAATDDAGLEVVSRVSVHGRVGKAALFRVWTMRRCNSATAGAAGAADGASALPWLEEAICVRELDGNWTEDYCALMEEMGIPTRRTAGAGQAVVGSQPPPLEMAASNT